MKTFLIAFVTFLGGALCMWIVLDQIVPSPVAVSPSIVSSGSHQDTQTGKKMEIRIPSIEYVSTGSFAGLYQEYRSNRFMEDAIGNIAAVIQIPQGLSIRYDACGEENAFYSADDHTITLCYELIDFYKKQIQENPESFGTGALNDLLLEVVSHEFGHAIIDMYHLPITGKEEDVADQISAFLLIGDRDDATIDAANSYYISAINDTSDKEDLPYWDSHSLDLQRYYNIMCWVYGSDPDYYHDFITDGTLPEDRADSCEDEYQQMSDSLSRLLAGHLYQTPTK